MELGGLRRKSAGLLASPGLRALAERLRAGATVIFYHGVEEEIDDPRVQRLHIPLKLFERQVEFLEKNYEIVSLSELCERLKSGAGIPASYVAITFDDGYRNILRNVLPLFTARRWPFSVFINTDQISTGRRHPGTIVRTAIFHSGLKTLRLPSLGLSYDISGGFEKIRALRHLRNHLAVRPFSAVQAMVADLIREIPRERWEELDERFRSEEILSWSEIDMLRRAGAEIGSHGLDHIILNRFQGRPEVFRQLRESRREIRERIGTCRYFAFPSGNLYDIGYSAYRAVRKCGYQLAFTTLPGEFRRKIDPFLAPRIGAATTFDHFRYKLRVNFLHSIIYSRWVRRYSRVAARARALSGEEKA
jgi:peptidoglycan/xylan/chitin deacetylase (PgdA/CDA1 family)